MSRTTFLIALDVSDPDLNVGAIKDFVRNSKDFPSWWNYLPGIFLVTTPLTAEEVSSRLHSLSESTSFLVIAVEPEKSQGWLPENSWNWIKRRERERGVQAAKPA